MTKLRAQVGQRLREWRRRRRLTQEQLAERAGLSYKFIGEIERGTGNPTLTTLERLSTALDIQIPDFFEPRGDREPRDAYVISARGVELAREAIVSLGALIEQAERPRPRRRRRS
jgi:transcriptional regulator with XRE-family HTH domain